MENVRKHRGIKFVTTEEIKNYLVSEPNYHATIFFQKIYQKNKKTNENKPNTHQQVFMNKPVYLGLSVLERSKIETLCIKKTITQMKK